MYELQTDCLVAGNNTFYIDYKRLMTFGQWLREKRKAVNLSQGKLADRATSFGVNVTPSYISNLERDYYLTRDGKPSKPSESVVSALAYALSVDESEARLAAGYAIENNARRLAAVLRADGISFPNPDKIAALDEDQYNDLIKTMMMAAEIALRQYDENKIITKTPEGTITDGLEQKKRKNN